MLVVGRVLTVLVALAALVGATAVTAGTARAQSVAPVRLMPLGDSITDGFSVPGGYRTDLWNALQQDGADVDFVGSLSGGPDPLGDRDHEGHTGWTIAQIDADVEQWLATHDPDTVLLHIGTNDMYGTDPAGAASRLATLVDRITTVSPDVRLLLATIVPLPAFDDAVRNFNAAVPGIVRSQVEAGKDVQLVDMYARLTADDLADGVHPGPGGYRKMAAAWYDALG